MGASSGKGGAHDHPGLPKPNDNLNPASQPLAATSSSQVPWERPRVTEAPRPHCDKALCENTVLQKDQPQCRFCCCEGRGSICHSGRQVKAACVLHRVPLRELLFPKALGKVPSLAKGKPFCSKRTIYSDKIEVSIKGRALL